MTVPTIYNFNSLFSTMKYPAGESHVAIKNYTLEKNPVILHGYCRNFEDICNVRTANNILKRDGVLNATWFVPYFPFARHDRRRFKGDGLELEVAMNILDGINVVTLDPHSDVLGVLTHIPQSEVVTVAHEEFNLWGTSPYIVIPDAGATKKALTWAKYSIDVIQAHKVRNTSTGELSGFGIDREDLNGKPCLIVDDICDAGGTFIGLADLLKSKNAGSLTLVVSHGLFTKGTNELLKRFDKIITVSNADMVYGEDKKGLMTISYAKMFQRGVFI